MTTKTNKPFFSEQHNSKKTVDVQMANQRVKNAMRCLDSRSQMKDKQVEWIVRQSGELLDGRVLVFGLGYDSLMWSNICDATFVEDNSKWYRKLFKEPGYQSLRAYLVNYSTKVGNWEDDLSKQKLNTLPPEIDSRRFDVIIIDGPRSYRPGDPGRVSAILHANRLVAEGGCIFVDDLNRSLEREVTALVLGKPDAIHEDRTLLGFWSARRVKHSNKRDDQ